MVERRVIRVEGIVQGVGFRPFVHRTAVRLGLRGRVRNDALGGVIDVEGEPARVADLIECLHDHAPPHAVVSSVRSDPAEPHGYADFRIAESDASVGRGPSGPIGPDLATCPECLVELRDPSDRRHGYALMACTRCGPRYTVVRGMPYDRARTSLADFPLCDACTREYRDPKDRRFHAEPIACPECGPRLTAEGAGSVVTGREAISAAADALERGGVIAMKGLGGYHLACDATHPEAVRRVRRAKGRDAKPLAVMVADAEAARRLCHLSAGELELLRSPASPIVLARARRPTPLADDVAPGLADVGVLLPYTPLHHLLVDRVAAPLVMTSANRSDEPIVFDDAEARARLTPLVDVLLTHDRAIEVRCDDSVVRWAAGGPTPLRRSRGYAPAPLHLRGHAALEPTLGVGGHLKSTFSFVRADRAFLSPHVGDLDGAEARGAWRASLERYRALFGIEPAGVAHDLHPDYASTRHAMGLGLPAVAVQHHHAHVASCAAEHGVTDPVLGFAFDGAGLGTDGAVWGGELLLVHGGAFERLAHLAYVPLAGGDAAAREPWRIAAAHLTRALGPDPAGWPVRPFDADAEAAWPLLRQMLDRGVRTPSTSSVGRLFDAVAAITGLCLRSGFEGHAAMRLEAAADPRAERRYRIDLDAGRRPWQLDPGALIAAVARDAAGGVPVPSIAGGFHRALADACLASAGAAREATDVGRVALTGGVFQNRLLTELCVRGLEGAGFEVLVHRSVPCNDGGLSLGQAVVGAALLAGDERADAPMRSQARTEEVATCA